MKYPTFKIKGSPTPNEFLVVCDKCGKVDWTVSIVGHVYQCRGCPGRMREATPAEYAAGKAALKEVIG
jgi:hypothetical protein